MKGDESNASKRLKDGQAASPTVWFDTLLERDLIPDVLIRLGIRRLLAARIAEQAAPGFEAQALALTDWIGNLQRSPVAIATQAANSQHYEVPADLFQMMLGPHLKYSCGLWTGPEATLETSERAMLEMVFRRAQLEDGQEVLDLGCGWGSFSLYAAACYPGSRFLAVSNSNSQRAFIEAAAEQRGLSNLEVVTADINQFVTRRRFDRIVSIEMFEHMRNYRELLKRIASWSKPNALLFVHIFCHRDFAYPFEIRDSSDWMAEHFFTGGQMPSENLLLFFQEDMQVQARWRVDGQHYARTCRAWLDQVDARPEEFLALCARVYGPEQAIRWRVRWRVFLMACEELFAYRQGTEWFVSHLLFNKP